MAKKKLKRCMIVIKAENKLKEALKSKEYTKTEKKKLREALRKVKDPTFAKAVCEV